jgi:hypothetical protein
METEGRADWLKFAWLVWVGLAVGFGVLAFFNPYAHSVYPIYAPASRRWWLGLDLYVRMGEIYRYSPLFAVALTPFAVLPDCWGGALWKAFNILVYACGLASACRHLLPAALTRNQRAALWVLALPLSLHSMYNGQANLIMVGTILLGLSAAARGRWNRAALWLAAATLVKGYPLALALLLSALYLRQFAPRFGLFLAAGLLLPFGTQGFGTVCGQYASWSHHLTESTGLARERLRSIDHLLASYRSPISPHTFALLGMASGLAALGICLWWARRLRDPRALLTRLYLLFAAWVVLFGPATESCSYVILGPAIAWAVVEAFATPGRAGRRVLLLLSLFLMGPSVTDLVGPTLRHLAYQWAAQPLGGLLFLALLLTQRPPAAGPAPAGLPGERPGRLAA